VVASEGAVLRGRKALVMNEQDQIEKTLDRLAEADVNAVSPYTAAKLTGVATLGAVASLALYALYQSLDPEYRRGLRQGAIDAAKAKARAWFSEE
jgi:hypothetical protein